MDVVLSVTDPSGVIIQKTQTVMSKYVRRELRSLSESDREVVFDSMHAMYAHTTEEGLAKGFGAKFKDIASFVSKHLDVGSLHSFSILIHSVATQYTSVLQYALSSSIYSYKHCLFAATHTHIYTGICPKGM